MGKEKAVVHHEEWANIITMDSAAQAGPEDAGEILVIGSHGAESTARHLAHYLPFGVILNDAGKGKNNAGLTGLPVLDAMAIIGATVDCATARIGDGEDSYSSGIISAVNEKAKAAGLFTGMPVRDACLLAIAAKKSARQLYVTEVAYESGGTRIILADSISFLNDSHSGSVIVSGSHCSQTTLKWTEPLAPKAVFLNDAGKGKDDCGISGLPFYHRAGIPAATVDCMTAMIGNARDAWENGLVSVTNELSAQHGVLAGMTIKEAAKRFCR